MPDAAKDVNAILSLYNKCRNSNALPVAGGVLDQPAWIMDLFSVIDNRKAEFNQAIQEEAEIKKGLRHG